jgi:PmbA protein
MSASLLETAKAAIRLAKKHGAEEVAATGSRSRDAKTTFRDGAVEELSESSSRRLSLSIFADGRFGTLSTSDLRPDALDRFVRDAVTMVKAITPDPHRRLPDPALYEGRSTADLDLFDASLAELTPERRIAHAKEIEEAARSHAGEKGRARIVSISATFSHSEFESARVTSNGFEGGMRSTRASHYGEVTVRDDDGRRPEDWAYAAARHRADLSTPEAVGREAAERALGRIGATKLASGTMNVVFEPRAAASMVEHLLGPLSGSALQQKRSFWRGQLGKQVGSRLLTIHDEPLLPRGLASRLYDGDGLTAKRRGLFEAGVLRSYLLDVYYARKLGESPTTGGTSNVVVTPGTKSLDALLRDMKDGIVVTRFLGGETNGTTGAFSRGVAGFRVERGERTTPIGEMNLAGSHLDLWKRLVGVGNDPYLWSSTRVPSLSFKAVSVAGK